MAGGTRHLREPAQAPSTRSFIPLVIGLVSSWRPGYGQAGPTVRSTVDGCILTPSRPAAQLPNGVALRPADAPLCDVRHNGHRVWPDHRAIERCRSPKRKAIAQLPGAPCQVARFWRPARSSPRGGGPAAMNARIHTRFPRWIPESIGCGPPRAAMNCRIHRPRGAGRQALLMRSLQIMRLERDECPECAQGWARSCKVPAASRFRWFALAGTGRWIVVAGARRWLIFPGWLIRSRFRWLSCRGPLR